MNEATCCGTRHCALIKPMHSLFCEDYVCLECSTRRSCKLLRINQDMSPIMRDLLRKYVTDSRLSFVVLLRRTLSTAAIQAIFNGPTLSTLPSAMMHARKSSIYPMSCQKYLQSTSAHPTPSRHRPVLSALCHHVEDRYPSLPLSFPGWNSRTGTSTVRKTKR